MNKVLGQFVKERNVLFGKFFHFEFRLTPSVFTYSYKTHRPRQVFVYLLTQPPPEVVKVSFSQCRALREEDAVLTSSPKDFR